MTRFLIFVMCSISLTVSAPIPKKMVDLSHVFDDTTLHVPGMKRFQLDRVYNGTWQNNENIWVQFEEYSSSIHIGTHMDAPCHFAIGRWCVDEIPLDRFIVPAAVIDVTQQAQENRDYEVTVDDLLHWEQQTGHLLNEVVVMMRSGWNERWPDRKAYLGTTEANFTNLHLPGFGAEAAQWLVDNRNIYGVGSDSLSLENGPATGTSFRTHKILLENNIYGLENVASMKELPIYGATLYIMPLKLAQVSGSPVRVVASFPEIIY